MTVKVEPSLSSWLVPESNLVAPAGTDNAVTVWDAEESWSTHTIVLLTPTTTVIVDGSKLRLLLVPTSAGMSTVTWDIDNGPCVTVDELVSDRPPWLKAT